MTTTKHELRALIAARKREYSSEVKKQKSEQIIKKLIETDEYKNARSILCYWSMSDEVQTHDFIVKAAQEKRVYLPVVAGDILLIREFFEIKNLTKGSSFSILEPDENANEIGLNQIDLVVVPGIAFDLNGGRLGRGKGFYDKLLTTANVCKIGICFDFQLMEDVPKDEFDVLMNKVIFG